MPPWPIGGTRCVYVLTQRKPGWPICALFESYGRVDERVADLDVLQRKQVRLGFVESLVVPRPGGRPKSSEPSLFGSGNKPISIQD